ncbi:Pls/PosA family non-ribosomal peptide synthetase [Plantibacter sp. VKM Ac-2876]|uniref:Pls/PosA family non-ribosomal peptide synthetase n=1 Tax=Plantibacter sp. VKM Ac-2876 TaxID=2783826 RepID=UPI00188B5DC9|nr:Pls/PosA family non-ribosomal peptide synthetase [Plantibacter sp. VKM Ac-2876]MBF4566869.1 amino acid adenylation domain-containing protein [Plantibacter sp. VKM Ac-2876]
MDADTSTALLIERQPALLGGVRAPAERTLLDVLRDVAASHPEASAIEDAEGALSYRELVLSAERVAAGLFAAGVRRGDRVGVRIASGTRDLYLGILGILFTGAAYVPVDADDPEERARLVFGEAAVVGVLVDGGVFERSRRGTEDPADDGADPDRVQLATGAAPHPGTRAIPVLEPPRLDDDSWIIFTSGSTGTPKGVAVSHRSAAAFVDAEARIFLQAEPLGPGDRVLAGLSVAFDASCEEMWLAWGHGACLVPAPRSLVRSGMDLGPWLTAKGITVVSTVPTLAAMWPAESLENIRMLIFGGEACPPELAARLAVDGREVWNTYGPTEATVVACAALLTGEQPVRIGLPLDGWDLAVVDAEGVPVEQGGVGELIIGGVGLARYLDPAKDAERYAPMPSIGWSRAYRSGDLVRYEAAGLVFQGRADDQVKIGGRRVELGEIEAALQALPGVSGAAAAVQRTAAGNAVLVGYLAVPDRDGFSVERALDTLREQLPAPLVPLLAVVGELPTRTSGKVDRAALPWPLGAADGEDASTLSGTAAWLAEQWTAVLGVRVTAESDNFFSLGGGSLAAAQLVSLIRTRDAEFTVADIYGHPRLGAMAAELDGRRPERRSRAAVADPVLPTPLATQWAQTLLGVPLLILVGLRWLVYLLAGSRVLGLVADVPYLPKVSWWWIALGFLVVITPIGRMAISVVAAKLLLVGVRPGDYPRGGSVHVRLWLAERVADTVGAVSLAGAPWISGYARALGAKIGADTDLHSVPPVTGFLTVGARASIEPEVDLRGYWVDGDTLRLGHVHIGAESTVGARSTLLAGTRIGKRAEIAPGSSVFGRVPSGHLWSGSPAVRVGKAKPVWPTERPPRRRRWLFAYGAGSALLSVLPFLAFVLAAAVVAAGASGATSLLEFSWRALLWVPVATLVWFVVLAISTIGLVRLLGLGLSEGYFPVRSRVGWQVWATERLLDAARTLLFPLYASLFTPVWLRLLGAKVGRNVEASTVLLLPRMTTVGDGAFLADDTMVASYELGGGWMRIAGASVGKRAFLGNSGMAGPGMHVPKNGLVAVLSAAPRKAKSGSSWLGSPPMRLRRQVSDADLDRTYDPPLRLRIARALWELCRIVPVMVTTGIALLVLLALAWFADTWGLGVAIAVSGAVLLAAGAVAAGITTVAKWVIVGPIRTGEHPLWSSFIWRNEVSDTFVEMVAAPWFAAPATGTPALTWWLRSLGARIGRGVWCESYWLPEADLVRLGDGATVNRGCVVQTHLFHDRIMSMDQVELASGATLGPHSVILPGARIDDDATVGPASLVMRGERVPAGTRWSGNPIGPWREVTTAEYREPQVAS